MRQKELVHVGTFGQPQGLKGEIKINIYTSSFESFKILKNFFIEGEQSVLVFSKIKKVGKKIIGSFENCKDRDTALSFKGKHILTLRENFPKTGNNEFYIVDLINCQVVDIKNNILGKVVNIQNFGAGDLIEIISDNKKNFYIPMNKDNLVKIDSEKKIIIVNPLKGILD